MSMPEIIAQLKAEPLGRKMRNLIADGMQEVTNIADQAVNIANSAAPVNLDTFTYRLLWTQKPFEGPDPPYFHVLNSRTVAVNNHISASLEINVVGEIPPYGGIQLPGATGSNRKLIIKDGIDSETVLRLQFAKMSNYALPDISVTDWLYFTTVTRQGRPIQFFVDDGPNLMPEVTVFNSTSIQAGDSIYMSFFYHGGGEF